MAPNVPMIRKVMEQIESDPLHWNQGAWYVKQHRERWLAQIKNRLWGRNAKKADEVIKQEEQSELCGTTMCFAGWTCYLAGDTVTLDDGDMTMVSHSVITTDGKRELIAFRAASLLGLDDGDADDLFHYFTDDPAVLRKRVEEIIGERL